MFSLDSALILLFTITNFMGKNWPGQEGLGIPSLSGPFFSILIAFTIGYLLVDVILLFFKKNIFHILKIILFCCIVVFSVGYPLLSNILIRHISVNYLFIHDGALQTEIATRFLLKGKNPYATSYFNTPLAQWTYTESKYSGLTNPALYHYTYLPFVLLTSAVGHVSQKFLLGWEDLRFTLFVEYLGILLVVWKLTKNIKERFLYLTLYALNPLVVHFLLEGRNDTASFLYILVSAFFLYRKNLKTSAIFLAFGMAFKQTLWLALPFFLCYVFYKSGIKNKFRSYFISFIITAGLIILPFIIWDPKNFIDSTIGYLSGTAIHSYPINGIGFAQILLWAKLIPNSHAYYPFWIFQFLTSGALMLFFLKMLKNKPRISYIFLFFSITNLVFIFFSRVFSDSYITLIFLTLITAILFYKKRN
jgi:uncharacterized membrane protein